MKEQQAINEALLRNMTEGIPKGKPTPSTNGSKIEPYPKWASSPRKEEKECTPKVTKEYHHIPSSGDSLSPRRKKQSSDDSLQG